MKINRIAWKNYRGLTDGEIIADGSDVLISGRNGAGKSSIASIFPFVMFGTDAAKSKHFDDGITPTDDGLVHSAEISFDNNLTLRRDYFWARNGNRQSLYINGGEVKAKDFDAKVTLLTNGGAKLICNPFAFCELKRDEQRNLLVKIFGQSPFTDANAEKILNGNQPDIFIAKTKREVDILKKDFAGIAPAIYELQCQLDGLPNIDAEIDSLGKKIDDAKKQRFELIDNFAPSKGTAKINAEIALLQKQRESFTAPTDFLEALGKRNLAKLVKQKDYSARQIKNLQDELTKLRAEYSRAAKIKLGICPACGQKIPLEKANADRDKRLADITARGKKISADIADLQDELDETVSEIDDLNQASDATQNSNADKIANIDKQLADLSNQLQAATANDKAIRDAQIATVDDKIAAYNSRLTLLKNAKHTVARINELHEREDLLTKKIATLENQLVAIKKFLHEKIQHVEDDINQNFQHVKFKLFDLLVTTGEIKPTCEPTLHGVPYSSLSKGERLKAALDIFIALQNHFAVELPLIIDDAEAYTQNSFVELPNQKFFFRVVDDDLNFSVSEVTS